MLAVSGLIFGCGGMPPAEAPAPRSEPAGVQAPAEETQSVEPAPAAAPSPLPPRVVEDSLVTEDEELTLAERELAAADAELSGAPAKRSREEAAEPGRGPGGEGAAARPKAQSPAQKTCATTCKAFASLLRARDSICRIDGSAGERCAHANQIVERHTERSTGCGCNG